ncbi:MAG: hypothetical protein V7632_4285 [Bradyrhizobium sp.]|jgi:hypothetical protein
MQKLAPEKFGADFDCNRSLDLATAQVAERRRSSRGAGARPPAQAQSGGLNVRAKNTGAFAFFSR